VERARFAVFAAVSVILGLAGAVLAGGSGEVPAAIGSVGWPVSTLLVSEVQTGGASASDEFAEITNVGASAVDLAGLELAYATSSGSTVTRKASWSTSLLLAPGRHLFVANSAGTYASLADATYSGGFAATGGAIVLRAIGGATIDAAGWGDATNAFVEGSPMAAPAAGASIERKPGGLAGNTVDTNANSVDWFSQPAPNPQSLAAPPVPAVGPTATPTATPIATPIATPSPSAVATPAPTPLPTGTPAPVNTPVPIATAQATETPSATPSWVPSPTPSVGPTVAPTAEPTPEPTTEASPAPTQPATPSPEPTMLATAAPTTAATPDPTAEPTPAPTSAPTATARPIISIAAARSLPDGASATITGVLTTRAGALESGRKGFVQDESAGIALYLDAAVVDGLPAGALVIATGTLDDRFAERTLRVRVVDLLPMGEGSLPAAIAEETGAIGEPVEGSRVVISGTTVGSASDLADGLGLMVDDGSGQVRVIVSPAALGGSSVPAGTSVIAVGPVGQRDSSGTGVAGYRIHVTVAGDFQISAPPSPSPTATSTPSAAPTGTPRPTATPVPSSSAPPTGPPTPTPAASSTPGVSPSPRPSATPTPTTSPTATPGPTAPPVLDIVEARGVPIGAVVAVSGVVTAEAGRLGLPPVIAIADGTGGIAVRLPDGAERPGRGTIVLVRGALADPYGQLELRPAAGAYSVTGHGSLPAPLRLTATQLGEATEGRLAELAGTVSGPPRKSTSGDLTIDLVDGAGTPFRVLADGSSGVAPTDLVKDRSYRLTGIVGQRATRKGVLDGYRLYIRDRGDILAVAAGGSGPGATPSPSAAPSASASPGAAGASVSVAMALAVPDGTRVTIELTVTAGASLLDASGRRIVGQDRSGAIEILLPTGTEPPAAGTRLRITGTTGLAWGAPRIAASEVAKLGEGASIQPLTLRRAPAERDEWLLVRISGEVTKVTRIGERWRAELTLADGSAALVQGQAGAGITSTSIVVGRRIAVTGIVRRPYPTASDRRFGVLPRSTSDIEGLAGGAVASSGAAGGGAGAAPYAAPGASAASRAASSQAAITPDTDLATLADVVGQRVKVGGLVARVAEDGFDLDDGTALARVELRGDMRALLPHLHMGEAVAATGVVELVAGAPMVVVDDEGALVRVGTLGEGLPIGDPGAPLSSGPPDASRGPIAASSSGVLGGPAPMSLFALASLAGLSVLATVLRRRLLRRRLRLALVERLRALPARRASPDRPDSNPPPPEI
jgi:hypothetical protein